MLGALAAAGQEGRGLLASGKNARLGEGELQKDAAADVPLVPVEVRQACVALLPVLMELCTLSPALSMAPALIGASCLKSGMVVALS